jgi:hypothetical protein
VKVRPQLGADSEGVLPPHHRGLGNLKAPNEGSSGARDRSGRKRLKEAVLAAARISDDKLVVITNEDLLEVSHHQGRD